MRVLFAVLMIATTAAAQTTTTTAKETNVVLDAADKHIVRDQFHDDEAVTLGGDAAGGWRLYAGAAIDARQIDLRMHDVKGELHFRADWTRLKAALARFERSTTRK